MKKQQAILLILLSTFALGACDKILNSTNLDGTWDIATMTQKTYTNGTLDSTDVQNDIGTITFNSGNDGSYSFTSEETTQSGTFGWFEENDKVFINMVNLSDSLLTKNAAIAFDRETDSKTEQVWSITYSQYTEDYETSVEYLMKSYIQLVLKKQ